MTDDGPSLYDLVLTVLIGTPRHTSTGAAMSSAAWHRQVAAGVERLVGQVGTVSMTRPDRAEAAVAESPQVATARLCLITCARLHNMDVETLVGPSRCLDVVQARLVAMYVTRETTRLGYSALGRMFGRDHTTVLSAQRRVRALMATDGWWAERVDTCMRALGVEQITLRPAAA